MTETNQLVQSSDDSERVQFYRFDAEAFEAERAAILAESEGSGGESIVTAADVEPRYPCDCDVGECQRLCAVCNLCMYEDEWIHVEDGDGGCVSFYCCETCAPLPKLYELALRGLEYIEAGFETWQSQYDAIGVDLTCGDHTPSAYDGPDALVHKWRYSNFDWREECKRQPCEPSGRERGTSTDTWKPCVLVGAAVAACASGHIDEFDPEEIRNQVILIFMHDEFGSLIMYK